MLSVRYFQKKDQKIPIVLFSNPHVPGDSSLEKTSSKITHTLFTSSLDPVQKMQDCRHAFHQYIQTNPDRLERQVLLSLLKTSLISCFQCMSVDNAIQEAHNTIAFITEYDATTLLSYPWINQSSYAMNLSVSIIHDLSQLFLGACWPFFDSLYKKKDLKCFSLLQDMLTSTLYYAAAHHDLIITYFTLLDNSSDSLTIDTTYLEHEIQFSTQEIEKAIQSFYAQLTHYAIDDGKILFHSDRMLFFSYASQAQLAIRKNRIDDAHALIEKATFFVKKHQHHQFYQNTSAAKPAKIISDLESKIKKTQETPPVLMQAKTPIKRKKNPTKIMNHRPEVEAETTTSPAPEKGVSINHKQREAARKRLKKRNREASEIEYFPLCYDTNPRLKNLLDQLFEIFKTASIEGFLFGSANYKENPGDFDILLPNIKTDTEKEHVKQLIGVFEAQGGVASRNNITGELGYHKGNRYVIPVTWQHWSIDFIVSEHDFIQHAKILDFTIGAMYFDLQKQTMFYMEQFSPLEDLHQRIIRTVGDPNIRFHDDPSLIFRGIRLCATEGFYFSFECLHAIKHAFFEEKNNLFMQLKRGKLYQQLNLILNAEHEQAMWNVLYQLNLFNPLWACLLTLPPGSGEQYMSRLQNHLLSRPPEIPPAYQPGFFMMAPLNPVDAGHFSSNTNNPPS